MYFKDAYGRMWLKTVNGFQNIGIKVTEKTVTFRKVDTVKVIPSPVVVPNSTEMSMMNFRETEPCLI